WGDGQLQRGGAAGWQQEGHPGGAAGQQPKPIADLHPLSPGDRGQRGDGRLRRRAGNKGKTIGTGKGVFKGEKRMRPKTKRIFSENNYFQWVEVLKRNREKRTKYRQCFVEGVKAIDCARQYNWPIRWFVYSREKPLSAWAKEVLATSRAELHLELPLRLMAKLSEKEEEISELIAVVDMVEKDLSHLE